MASGDIALTVPKSVPNLPLAEVNISIVPSPFMTITFVEVDEKGKAHVVRITNAANGVQGFDVVGSVITDDQTRALSGYLTTILGVLFIGNASTLNQRKTALVQRLITDGVIVVTGTVG